MKRARITLLAALCGLALASASASASAHEPMGAGPHHGHCMDRSTGNAHHDFALRMHHHRQNGGVRSDRHGYAPLSRFLSADVLATMDRQGVAVDPKPFADADGVPLPGGGAGPLAEVDDLIRSLLG